MWRRGTDSDPELLDDDSSIDPLNSSVVCLGYAPKKKIEMVVLSSDEENSPNKVVPQWKSRVQDNHDEDEPELMRQTESDNDVEVLNASPPFRLRQPNNTESRMEDPRSQDISKRLGKMLRMTRRANAERVSALRSFEKSA